MRVPTALAIIMLAASVCACGGAAPTTPVSPTPVVPQTPVDLKTSLSGAFDALAIPAGAACSLAISQHGQVLLERGRGETAPGRPATVNSLYRIASLTKPLTASAVLISEQAGRLNRNDKIAKYFAYAEPAPTLDQLIKHIPGLFNYTDTWEYQAGKHIPTTLEGLLSLMKPWDGIHRNQYSNSHYVYLGGVLQQVNGLRYEDVIQRDIFGPAGMTQSSFSNPPASETVGYPYPSKTDSSWVMYGGGVTSTAADMTRFLQALLNNQFGFGAVEGFDRSAGVTSFGMGVSGGADLRFTHSGGLDSYSSFNVFYPADRSSVVVLCNFNTENSINLVNFVLQPGGIRSIMLAAK
jgi:D-alanyl-D-alanine carboxypeptidase